MKCPVDQAEMELGSLEGNSWMKGKLNPIHPSANLLSGQAFTMHAYRCPKCEKIELTTKSEARLV